MKHVNHDLQSVATDHTRLILDGSKIDWHLDRVTAWESGERFPPITIDMALTRACNYSCVFCYAVLQENDRKPITIPVNNYEDVLLDRSPLDTAPVDHQ